MNKVKFVPANPRVRALAASEVLVIEVGQSRDQIEGHLFRAATMRRKPTLPEAEYIAGRRGWTRLAYLPKSERARYAKAKEIRG